MIQNNEFIIAKKDKSDIDQINLILDNKQIDSKAISQLGLEISQCKNLHNLILNLSDNTFDLQGFKAFTSQIIQCVQIEHLNLNLSNKMKDLLFEQKNSYNKLGDKCLTILGREIAKLVKLKILNINLSFNDLTEEGIEQFGIYLLNCLRLNTLSIYLQQHILFYKWKNRYNSLKETGLAKIIQGISCCIDLKELNLYLSGNNLKNIGMFGLAQEIQKCSNLVKLKFFLNQNGIEDIGIYALIESISNLKNLQILCLYLSFNLINDFGVIQIGKFLSQLQSLKGFTLNLMRNQLSYKGIHDFVQSLSKLQRITYLRSRMDQTQEFRDQQRNRDYHFILRKLTHLVYQEVNL